MRTTKLTKWMMIVGLVLVVGITALTGCIFRTIFSTGRNAQETAHILVHNTDFGMRAEKKAIEYGDEILPPLKRESNNFQELNGRNAFWIADVLGSIQTENSRSILLDLYSRTDNIAKLVGGIGLAQHKALPDPINENSFLVQTVRKDTNQTQTQLAIIALGKSRSKDAVPCLVEVLKKRPNDYWHHAYACEALARIRSPEAIPALRDCLQSEQFHALSEAFRALIVLGDKQAVPLAIARITPDLKGYNSSFVVRELRKVTDRNYRYNRNRWKDWWESVESTWQIPESYKKPYDEQEEML